MTAISKQLLYEGDEVVTFSADSLGESTGIPWHYVIPEGKAFRRHIRFAEKTGMMGLGSIRPTRELVQRLEQEKPDLLQLHNIHTYDVNLPILFRYLKKSGIQVVYTIHDCWAFTGRCAHYSMNHCEKWKTGCGGCDYLKASPEADRDYSAWMWKIKKKCFTGLKNLYLAAPSEWMAEQIGQSFLRDVPARVIHNGISNYAFHPMENRIKKELGCEKKILLLGCAMYWSATKGLDIFGRLAGMLDDGKYQIVLIGIREEQKSQLPAQIVTIPVLRDEKKLAEYYSAADIFLNPTREEVFGLTNAEALACGTPVVGFASGGSKEIVDATCGKLVPCDDLEALAAAIKEVLSNEKITTERCLARAKRFSEEAMAEQYAALYHELLTEKQQDSNTENKGTGFCQTLGKL